MRKFFIILVTITILFAVNSTVIATDWDINDVEGIWAVAVSDAQLVEPVGPFPAGTVLTMNIAYEIYDDGTCGRAADNGFNVNGIALQTAPITSCTVDVTLNGEVTFHLVNESSLFPEVELKLIIINDDMMVGMVKEGPIFGNIVVRKR